MVRNRLQKQGIGFGATVLSKEDDYKFLKDTRAEDLITYGFESEFIGRLPEKRDQAEDEENDGDLNFDEGEAAPVENARTPASAGGGVNDGGR